MEDPNGFPQTLSQESQPGEIILLVSMIGKAPDAEAVKLFDRVTAHKEICSFIRYEPAAAELPAFFNVVRIISKLLRKSN